VKSLLGGVCGWVDDCYVVVGNAQLVRTSAIKIPNEIRKLSQGLAVSGETPIFIAVNNLLVGLLGLSDPVRPQAAQLVSAARQMGWKVGIISGDLPEIVDRVGLELGLPSELCRGGISPEDKLAAIRQSRNQFPTVVMIGDGANDAAALAAADVGIAVRGGAEVSLHAAPVFLASNQLMNIARLLRGSQTTMRVIYLNFAVSLTYNLIAVGLVLCGLISPLLAAIIMPLSSVTVLGLTFLIPSFSANRPFSSQAQVAS
jgi:Cu2+-exporting ATPase